MPNAEPHRDARGAPAERGVDPPAGGKRAWRRRIAAQRACVTPQDRAAEAASLTRCWRRRVLATLRPGQTVCAYVPAADEPGDVSLLDAARDAGLRVLVPVTPAPGPLQWAEYTGRAGLRAGRFGLLEPAGRALAPAAVAEAAVVLVPALAVDRRGVRLGRGGGYYDRTLPAVSPAAALICLVRDAELVDELPEDPHDVRVSATLTPAGGLVAARSD